MLIRGLVSLLLLLSSTLAVSQQATSTQVLKIGFVAPQGRSLPLFDAFREGLRQAGYIEGKNVSIEARFAEGQYDRLPSIFKELADAKVDLVAVTGAVTARAAKKEITALPIVFSVVVDPVADHVVQSLEKPGGNLTGLTTFDPQQARKQLEVLRLLTPNVKKIAILGDKGVSEALISSADHQARDMGLMPLPIRVTGPDPDWNAVFTDIQNKHADALLVLEEPVLGVHAKEIGDLALAHHLPSLFPPSRASAGGLVCYGVSQTEAIRHMADYIDKIAKGAKPDQLPVQQIDKYELVINRKTAKELGITVPQDLQQKADRVID